MNDTKERVARCFATVFPDIRQDEIATASMESVAGWDSVAHVILLSSIAEEFGLNFDLEEFRSLVSYALIVDFLERNSAHG